jgi:hypothetical protein
MLIASDSGFIMSLDSQIHRAALARVAGNLSMGMLPFLLFAALIPSVELGQQVSLWASLAVCLLIRLIFARHSVPYAFFRNFGAMRLISSLLLGASFLVIFWKWQHLEFSLAILILSFSLRWLLYVVETRNLELADRQRLPLPSLATKTRRAITFVTGAVIPILIFAGMPAVPFLIVSFFLTAFSQWAIAYEELHRRGVESLNW